MKHHLGITLLALLSAGCASDRQPPPAAPTGGTDSWEPTAQASEEGRSQDPAHAQIQISDRIRQACGLDDTEAYFAYNRANVSGQARSVLQKLATCFTTGPLAGERLKLVGHADPRGDEEYNMVLGQRRADNVEASMSSLGMSKSSMSTTSRGEMDAVGGDEVSWAKDRKVEVKIDD